MSRHKIASEGPGSGGSEAKKRSLNEHNVWFVIQASCAEQNISGFRNHNKPHTALSSFDRPAEDNLEKLGYGSII
jgi:hypothetical protein